MMINQKYEYSIVIPVYKSGIWMDDIVERIGTVMERESTGLFELILVNDSSPDTITWSAIKRNAQQHPWVKGLNLLYNVGQFRATMCGLEQARGQYIITMDDDLQHLPEDIPILMRTIQNDRDVLCVMGNYEIKKHNRFRNMGTRLYQYILRRHYGKSKDIHTSSFRIMRKELVQALLACRTTRPQITPLILALTKRIKNVRVTHNARPKGRSGYSLTSLLNTTLESIVNSSTFPLRIFSVTGFVCATGSILLAVILFYRWCSGGIRVAGYTSQVLLITFFGGMTLAGIGVVGEYVARIISEITGPERYRIFETTNTDNEVNVSNQKKETTNG